MHSIQIYIMWEYVQHVCVKCSKNIPLNIKYLYISINKIKKSNFKKPISILLK